MLVLIPVLGILYVILIVMVMLQAYGLRLRHVVASHFYPEREKDRIRFLHRKLLRRRVIMLKELKVCDSSALFVPSFFSITFSLLYIYRGQNSSVDKKAPIYNL